MMVVVLSIGAILIATPQLAPQILQENYGNTATWAGLARSLGCLVTMFMMFVVRQLTSIFHRNTGGSIGVSVASTVLAHREQWPRIRPVEHVAPSDPNYFNTMTNPQNFFVERGSSAIDAQNQAIGFIGRQVQEQEQEQASYLAYIDVFHVLAIISACAIPLALILRKIDLKSGGGPAH